MADTTLIVTTAITAIASGGVGLAAAGFQARTSRLQLESERDRETQKDVERRRRERQKSYQDALDLLTDFAWDYSLADESYDVVERFNKPFLRAGNRVRLYGSPAAIAAIDEILESFRLDAKEAPEPRGPISESEKAFQRGRERFYKAARDDVGPRPQDELPDVPYRAGGPAPLYD